MLFSVKNGHVDRFNTHSTRAPRPNTEKRIFYSTTNVQNTKKKYINIYAAIDQPEIPTGKIHSDQTGRFPVQSSSGKEYMMVIYAYDPNAILVKTLPDISKESIVQAYQK